MPKYFEVDGKEMDLKPGAIGSHIKAEINVITCRTQITKNINLLLGRAGKKLAGFICTPLAASGITLTEEEKRLGCVLVDFGADITTVSIYKNNHLQYLNVIPMGSRNITRDLVLPVKGWNFYDTISLKWDHQIVATRRKPGSRLNIAIADENDEEKPDNIETMTSGKTN
nr:unnamed protein product [uncultured bacterium]